ncbi:hypothetical protein [Zestomonas carbonaria]|uniref:Lipoprotein n=1 Tax=Zestomonas carbonaria TaxID=2762745 RepID=A0A7U7I9S4_9GAMM|nr:hypothetical protein [Pseudomonas carbonaria]CAD5108595.1 hypothetical protein PSEWESI4_02887 [Pseudomonas carbonaria]
MTRYLPLIALFGALLGLTGCATPQPPVPLDQAFWTEKQDRIGVAYNDIPKPTVAMVGQQGLLDIAINQGLASGLRSKVETWDAQALERIPVEITGTLKEQGYQAVQLPKPLHLEALGEAKEKKLGYFAVDASPLKQRYQVDKLVLLSFSNAGTERSYYGMIPTSDPVSRIVVSTYVVDLDDNRLLYYKPIVVSRTAEGEWDESPEFPNLTNAFYQALDATHQELVAPFRNQQLSLSDQ